MSAKIGECVALVFAQGGPEGVTVAGSQVRRRRRRPERGARLTRKAETVAIEHCPSSITLGIGEEDGEPVVVRLFARVGGDSDDGGAASTDQSILGQTG